MHILQILSIVGSTSDSFVMGGTEMNRGADSEVRGRGVNKVDGECSLLLLEVMHKAAVVNKYIGTSCIHFTLMNLLHFYFTSLHFFCFI